MESGNGKLAVVFIHGFISSPKAWTNFTELMASDPDMRVATALPFAYRSPKLRVNPLHRIPDLDDVADSLQGFLRIEAKQYERLFLVSHSQGGLVVQRYLARMLSRGQGMELARIHGIVLFACPNSGSELLLSLRRAWLRGHPQERGLRPFNGQVLDAQSRVVNQIVHAKEVAPHSCPIPITAYAGESDNIVTRASAQSVFKDVGVLPGNHSSIINPRALTDRSYTAFKEHVLIAVGSRSTTTPGPTAPPAALTSHESLGARSTPGSALATSALEAIADEFGWTDPRGESIELIDFRKNLASLAKVLATVRPADRKVLGVLLRHGTARVSEKQWGEVTYGVAVPLLHRTLDISAGQLAEHLDALQDRELALWRSGASRNDGEGSDADSAYAETDGRRDTRDAYVFDRLRVFCHARGADVEKMIERLDFTALH